MALMQPGTAFTGYDGISYPATTTREIPPAAIQLALKNGWQALPVNTPVGNLDNPVSPMINTLFSTAIPFIIAPTGSMANNGVITLGGAIAATYPSCYLALPANAISTGSAAGWYYAAMSSGTVGQVFNNTYVNGPAGIPASPVAFVTTGPGAYTGVTTAVVGPSITLPAGYMGLNGQLEYRALFNFKGNTNNKTVTLQLGASNIFSLVEATASVLAYGVDILATNQGAAAAQVINQAGYVGTSTVLNAYTTVNTAVAQTLSVTMQLATATDYVGLDMFQIQLTV